MLTFLVSVSVISLAFIAGSHGHSYSLGSCPAIEPMNNFQMNRMLGIWYVIQKTSTASTCLTYNFTRTNEPGEYMLEQVSQHFLLTYTPLNHGYHYRGTLKIPDETIPAKMIVRFPLSVAGSAGFTVFMTDYDNFAGIFTCQKLAFAHRQSATILSRTKDLDKVFVDKVRNRLSQNQIDPFELSIIKQKDCPNNLTDAYNININDETISAKAAADLLRKAGEKIGDGVEYVADKTQTVYHKLADRDGGDKVGRLVTPDPNSEWLP